MVKRVAMKAPRTPRWRMEKVAALMRPISEQYQKKKLAA
jgi:hypothetical protein